MKTAPLIFTKHGAPFDLRTSGIAVLLCTFASHFSLAQPPPNDFTRSNGTGISLTTEQLNAYDSGFGHDFTLGTGSLRDLPPLLVVAGDSNSPDTLQDLGISTADITEPLKNALRAGGVDVLARGV